MSSEALVELHFAALKKKKRKKSDRLSVMFKTGDMDYMANQEPSFLNLVSRKNILKEDVPFNLAVFFVNYIRSPAL